MRRVAVLIVAVSIAAPLGAPGPARADCGERLLVLSAFPGEIDMLLTEASVDDLIEVNGFPFWLGTLEGNDVMLGLTGIGLLNAEAAARAAIEDSGCSVSGVVFSGVSGGQVSIGDVVVPAAWTEDGTQWFASDPAMLAVASSVADAGVELSRAVPPGDVACVGADPRAATVIDLPHEPAVFVGGQGRSADPFGGRAFPCFAGGGDVFGCRPCRAPIAASPGAEHAAGFVPFLDPGFFFGFFQNPPSTSGYDVDDMETTAVARVAAEHEAPFIAFRALSDGAGDPLMLPGFPFQFFVYRQLAADNAARVALAFLQAWGATH